MAGETPAEKGAPAPAAGESVAPPKREYYYKIVAVMLLAALTCLLDQIRLEQARLVRIDSESGLIGQCDILREKSALEAFQVFA